MSFDNSVAITFIVSGEVMMYVTLPLHARLLFVLLRPSSKKDLDSSFHTLMINTTLVNLLFSLDCCFILEPSASGVFFDFYEMMGPYFAKIDLIKTTMLLLIADVLQLVLAMNRFSAIAFPIRHHNLWRGRKLFWFCVGLWMAALIASIPLILPGSTTHYVNQNLYGVNSVEFNFQGNYYFIYSMGSSLGGGAIVITGMVFYIGMVFKFRTFSKFTKSGASEVKKMTRGVMRTTMAACCISAGSWILVIFMVMVYISWWTRGQPLVIGNYFSAIFRFLTAINNILTPWVMLLTFENVRHLVVFGKANKRGSASPLTMASSTTTKF